jgi:hypothetical protein
MNEFCGSVGRRKEAAPSTIFPMLIKLAAIATCLTAVPLQDAFAAQVDTLWVWRDSTGSPHSKEAFDSAMNHHLVWLRSGEKKGRRANFRYAFFSGLDLSGRNLEKAIFSGARFIRTNLSGARLRDAALDYADLSGATLRTADLTRADLDLANLRGADLRGAVLNQTSVLGTNLAEAHLEGVDLSLTRREFGSTSILDNSVYYDDSTRWPEGAEIPANLNTLPAKVNRGISRFFDTVLGRWGGMIFIVMLAVLTVTAVVAARAEAKKVTAQEDKVKNLEAAPHGDLTLPGFVQAELAVAIERERVSMLLAQSRSARLFTLGTVFIVLSLLAPLVAIMAYVATDPVESLQKALASGIKVANAENALQRDWHILLSGVSFGFLFLAAAAGLLRQARHHTTTYFRLRRRVTHFEAMISALKISERIGVEADITPVGTAVRRVVDQLMHTAPSETADEPDSVDGKDASHTVEALSNLLEARRTDR